MDLRGIIWTHRLKIYYNNELNLYHLTFNDIKGCCMCKYFIIHLINMKCQCCL